jgi:hypothetical protein
VEPVCGNVRLFVGRWRLGRGTGPGIRRFFWNAPSDKNPNWRCDPKPENGSPPATPQDSFADPLSERIFLFVGSLWEVSCDEAQSADLWGKLFLW